ncbi:hypothetical protein SAMN05192533_10599 [Mesobacillus persicus]|uniref:Uncharacterized protein n=1 Tax=Mesobacillus persicus TaxID=930146 RepID=A0A1H8APM3_9BACI|nr:hypothetical protein [Mesobacillus persicus]SEM72456.1 hypothetical protein SAMN05192533_10599 [Mesobacillus persicus]
MHAVLRKIAKGYTVCYSEVFPDQDNDYFHLAYMGKLFLIADSYCLNPDCTCQEAALNFVQVYPREDKKNADSFMVRFKLNGRGYKIHEQGHFHRREIKSIMMHFNADKKVGKLLNERFKEMREKTSEILS